MDKQTYTYTIFDGNPACSGPCSWSTHEDVEIEAASADEAVDAVRQILAEEASCLSEADGYLAGNKIYALVWDADGRTLDVSHVLSDEDLA